MKSNEIRLIEYEKDMEKMNIWEYEIIEMTDGKLTIMGSMEFAYYHEVELYFENVTHLALPCAFGEVKIRLATQDEIENELRKRFCFKILSGQQVFVLHTEAGSLSLDNGDTYVILASRFNYKVGVVYHYMREDLEEGERIAPWVLEREDEELE